MNNLKALQTALITIRKLKQLLKEQKKTKFSPLAIVGIGCRFPQAINKEEYWNLLSQGKNIIAPLPADRWGLVKTKSEIRQYDENIPYWGGYLENIADFDANFFGINPREAQRMDPQQRLMLEVAYEALEDAGLPVEGLAGSKTGVFVSLYANSFGRMQGFGSDMEALYITTGNAISIAANRLSYLFDLRGPSMVFDTACSSSLVALHMACLNLQAQLCDQALVGAANINLLPSLNAYFHRAKISSQVGQCKTFDAAADGYVQGEGAGFIVIKPLTNALRDNDRIYAVIAGSAVNQNGKTNGLTTQNKLQQEKVLKAAYSIANMVPGAVSYVECHGASTLLEDSIEIQALGEVIGQNRDREHPCWIGSVKTNIGNLEPASGIASVIKVALAIKHAQIPPHLNFSTPNPLIEFKKYNLNIPQQLVDWPSYQDKRIAGISGFGFGGTNSHVVMESILDESKPSVLLSSIGRQEIFTLSAKNPTALMQFIEKWRLFLKNNSSSDLGQICYNLHVKRSHYSYRLAVICNSTTHLCEQLYKIKDDLSADSSFIFITTNKKNNYQFANSNKLNQQDLKAIATAYINQEKINWADYEKERIYQYIDMPSYPWQHKLYWPDLNNVDNDIEKIYYQPQEKYISTIQNSNQHEDNILNKRFYPLQVTYINSPLDSEQFKFTFDINILPEIKDSFNIIHAGYYIEMLACVMDHLYQENQFTIENMKFLSPIIVNEDIVQIYVCLFKDKEDNYSFVFYTQSKGKNSWIEHAKGILVKKVSKNVNYDAVEAIINRCVLSGDTDTFQNRISELGMPIGDTIRWTQRYWVGKKEAICKFRLPKVEERNDDYYLKIHFGIIDGCIQTIFMLMPDCSSPYVASSIGKFTFYGKQDSQMYAFTTLKEFLSNNSENVIASWYLVDKFDRLIAACEAITMTRLNSTINIDSLTQTKFKYQDDLSLSLSERTSKITKHLISQTANILSMPESDIDIHQSLYHLGLDSLVSLALIREIEDGFNVSYPLEKMIQGPSLSDVIEYILNEKTQFKITQKRQENPWIEYRKPQPNTKIKLFCFPYGGGGASMYREWQDNFPKAIEVCPIQLPGRESRMGEEPIRNIDSLVHALVENLQGEFSMPFAMFGHSFGSLIIFEMARYFRRNSLPSPIHLFVSAYPSPDIPSRSLDNLLSHLKSKHINLLELTSSSIKELSQDQLNTLHEVFKQDGVFEFSDEPMDKRILKVLLPIFISDMDIVQSYCYKNELPLDIPITAFAGKRDNWVSYDDHLGWVTHTQKACTVHTIDGGHLFVKNTYHREIIIQKIVNSLINLTAVPVES